MENRISGDTWSVECAAGSTISKGAPWTPRTRMVAWAALVAWALAGCTPFGFARGDYWQGKSTGDLGGCAPFDFHVVVEDKRIGGWATTEFDWGTAMWELKGVVGAERQVTIEAKTKDPRVPQPSLTWSGTYNPIFWEISHGPDPSCPTPRTANLQRR